MAYEPVTASRFAAWRLVCWLLLLLAALGILQYVEHGWQAMALLHAPGRIDGHAAAGLRRMLAWDGIYLVGACVALTAAAGALLRREWARRLLRVVAALLALWALATAVAVLAHWQAFQQASAGLLAQADTGAAMRVTLVHLRRVVVVGTALKLAAAPVLAWLAWRLGLPSMRAQFRRGSKACAGS